MAAVCAHSATTNKPQEKGPRCSLSSTLTQSALARVNTVRALNETNRLLESIPRNRDLEQRPITETGPAKRETLGAQVISTCVHVDHMGSREGGWKGRGRMAHRHRSLQKHSLYFRVSGFVPSRNTGLCARLFRGLFKGKETRSGVIGAGSTLIGVLGKCPFRRETCDLLVMMICKGDLNCSRGITDVVIGANDSDRESADKTQKPVLGLKESAFLRGLPHR